MKILVISAYKTTVIDNFEKGELPNTEEQYDLHIGNGIFDSFEDLASECGCPTNKENWMAFDSGRIICNVTENKFSEAASEEEMEDFRNGLIDLYASSYNFYIQFMQTHTPSAEEIAEELDIEMYD